MKRQWLIDIRQNRQLYQKDIAAAADVSIMYISLIESGNKTPAPAVAKKIANFLGFSYTLFYDDL